MGFRRQARELAMKMLFQIDVGSLSPRDVILHFLEEVNPSAEVSEHAKALTKGVVKEIDLLDRLLTQKAKNWNKAYYDDDLLPQLGLKLDNNQKLEEEQKQQKKGQPVACPTPATCQ